MSCLVRFIERCQVPCVVFDEVLEYFKSRILDDIVVVAALVHYGLSSMTLNRAIDLIFYIFIIYTISLPILGR